MSRKKKLSKAEQQALKEQEEKKQKQLRLISIIAACVVIVIVIAVVVSSGLSNGDNGEATGTKTTGTKTTGTEATGTEAAENETSGYVTDINADWYADIEIENYGTIKVGLDSSYAPETVANFVSLAQSGFYDGLTFHRIMDGFMMQGGDPEGNGTGGSDKTIYGEFTANGSDNNLSHVRGAISMARSQAYDSASSQFFIVHEDSTFLDGQYAAFGYVTEGMEIVDEICSTAEPTDSNGSIAAENQPVITSIKVYQ